MTSPNWSIHVGDLLDVPADVLICSANVYLNLSGGVGGALALRYGAAPPPHIAARDAGNVPGGRRFSPLVRDRRLDCPRIAALR